MYTQNSMIGTIFLIVFLLTVQRSFPRIIQPRFGNIAIGVGYSEDSQQIVSQVCYKTTKPIISDQQSRIQLGEAISFSELERELGVSVNVGGKIAMFSADAQASYMRSVQNKDLSISFNYYEYATNNVAVQIAGFGEEALTDFGKVAYNSGKNSYFGLLCGNNYITSYKQGALLIMGLNIKFSSSHEKTTFEGKIGISWSNIVNAAAEVKKIANEYKISGSISIQAFQMGGEPSQLSKILNMNNDGRYYAASCNLESMDDCIYTASGLLDYAKNNFAEQFSFQENRGLTPLGIAFAEYNPIELIGLTYFPLVTPEVKKYRREFACKLKENEYYQQKIFPFLNNGYPVELESDIKKKIIQIQSKVDNNIAVLRDLHSGAINCFNLPQNCKKIKDIIDSELQQITEESLNFIKNMKYTLTALDHAVYSTGGDSSESWSGVIENSADELLISMSLFNVFFDDNRYRYDMTFYEIDFPGIKKFVHFDGENKNGASYNGSIIYDGISCAEICRGGDDCVHWKDIKQISPFFFEPYYIAEQCS